MANKPRYTPEQADTHLIKVEKIENRSTFLTAFTPNEKPYVLPIAYTNICDEKFKVRWSAVS